MLLYLSESKLKSIIDEANLFHKENIISKYLEDADAKLELKTLTISGRIRNFDRNLPLTHSGLGIVDCVTNYLRKTGKLHKFNKMTKKLKVMHAYEIMGQFSLKGDDNPEINMEENKTIFEYMMKNPNEITTLTLATTNKKFPTIKLDCSNKNIWFVGQKNGGKSHLMSWSLSQRWDLKFSHAIVKAIVHVTEIDDESKIVYGSPLYITV